MTDADIIAELKRLELALSQAMGAAEGDVARQDNLLRAMNSVRAARDLLTVGPDRGAGPDDGSDDPGPLVH